MPAFTPATDKPRRGLHTLYSGARWLLAAIVIVEYITLQWTPGCGGVAYGFPFLYIAGSDASSQTFVFEIGPFCLDVMVTLIGLRIIRGWSIATFGRRNLIDNDGMRRSLAVAMLVVFAVVALLGSPWVMATSPGEISHSQQTSPRPHVGTADWVIKDCD